MFELHLGDKVSVPSTIFKDGVFLAGRAEQGKSTTSMCIILAAIENSQRGIFFDPYGDLANALKEKITSAECKKKVEFLEPPVNQKDLKQALEKGKMVIVATHFLRDGERKTRETGQKFLKMAYGVLKPGDWIFVDEIFGMIDDELLEMFMESRKRGMNFLYCDRGLDRLSEKERHEFCKLVSTFIVYKTMNFDAVCLQKENAFFDPKRIAAIEQYHFQLFTGGKLTYAKGLWPIPEI